MVTQYSITPSINCFVLFLANFMDKVLNELFPSKCSF